MDVTERVSWDDIYEAKKRAKAAQYANSDPMYDFRATVNGVDIYRDGTLMMNGREINDIGGLSKDRVRAALPHLFQDVRTPYVNY